MVYMCIVGVLMYFVDKCIDVFCWFMHCCCTHLVLSCPLMDQVRHVLYYYYMLIYRCFKDKTKKTAGKRHVVILFLDNRC